MEPAFDGAAVEEFAFGGGDLHDTAVFDIVVDGVGNHVFLIFGAEIIFVDIFDDFLE